MIRKIFRMINKSSTTSLAYKAPGSFEETRYEKLHNVIVESSTTWNVVDSGTTPPDGDYFATSN